MVDEEIERWSRDWRAFEGKDEAMDWYKKAQRAHRREATVRMLYWSWLAVGALAVGVAVSILGVVSWLRLAIGVGALLFGAGYMLRSGAEIRRAHQQLTATPAGIVADLIRVHERELEGWTGKNTLWVVALLYVVAASVAARELYVAAGAHLSLLRPLIAVGILAVSLVVLIVLGRVRVPTLRGELARLRQLHKQLT